MRGSTPSACRVVALWLLAGGTLPAWSAIRQPTDVAGCRLWLAADDAATIVQAGNPGFVEQWSDKSGNGLHVTQAAVANQPATGVQTLGGRNVLTFDGGDDWLAGAAVLAAGDDDFTYFAVWRPRKTTGSQVVFEQSQTPQTAGTRAALLAVNTAYGFNGEFNDAHNLVPFTADVWRLTGLEVDGRASRNVLVHDNGATAAVGSINLGTENVGTTGTRVGAKLTTNGENLNGDIAEIVVYDRVLTDTELNQVLYYLQQKWGLACGLQDADLVVDFSHDQLPAGWTKTGAAFDTQPVSSTRVTFNQHNDWFVGTFENEKNGGIVAQGDAAVGTLTGTPFTLQGNTIRALVGGGHHYEVGAEAQLQLERDLGADNWTVVRKEAGQGFVPLSPAQGEAMREIRWNVHDLLGASVRFKLVDNNAGSWGHINTDRLRVLNEPVVKSFNTDFDGTTLDASLIVYRPCLDPNVALTGTGTLRFNLADGQPHDLWASANKAAQVRLSVVNSAPFSLETRLVSRTYTGVNNSTGLLLVFADPDANTFDFVSYGAYTAAGFRVEGPNFPGIGITFPTGGPVTAASLRIKRLQDTYSFMHSMDGTQWTTDNATILSGKTLLYVGLFTKCWTADNPVTEFDYLRYEQNQQGTVLVIR